MRLTLRTLFVALILAALSAVAAPEVLAQSSPPPNPNYTKRNQRADGDIPTPPSGAINEFWNGTTLRYKKSDGTFANVGGGTSIDGGALTPGVFPIATDTSEIGDSTLSYSSNVLSLVNGTSAQRLDLYNSFTSATDLEALKLAFESDIARIGTFKGASGGTARSLALITDDATRVTIAADGSTVTLAGGTSLVLSGGTSGTMMFTAPAAAGTQVYTLPADDGDAGEQLTTDGAGVLTWQAAGAGVGGSGTAGRVARFTAGTTLGDSLFADDGTNVQLTSGLLRIHGATSSFPAITNSGAFLAVVLADASLYGNIAAAHHQTHSGGQFRWSSDGAAPTSGSVDTGVGRAASGIVSITDGGSGLGALRVADGSDAVPGIQWTDDTTGSDNGFKWVDASDHLTLVLNGAVAHTFGSSFSTVGSVGAGAGNSFTWTGRSRLNSPADGIVRVMAQDNTTIGVLQVGRLTVAKTTDYGVLTTDSNVSFTNEGATALVTFTLPAASSNLGPYTFTVQDSDGLAITAVGDDTIRIAASVTAAAGTVDSTTIGDSVTLVAINGTEWVAIMHVGTGF